MPWEVPHWRERPRRSQVLIVLAMVLVLCCAAAVGALGLNSVIEGVLSGPPQAQSRPAHQSAADANP
jgi:hypothetical protein